MCSGLLERMMVKGLFTIPLPWNRALLLGRVALLYLGMVTLQAWLFWLLLRGAIPLLVTNVQGFLHGAFGAVLSHSIGVISDPITAISCTSKRTCRYPEDKRCLLQRKVLGFLGDVMWFLILPCWLSFDFWG